MVSRAGVVGGQPCLSGAEEAFAEGVAVVRSAQDAAGLQFGNHVGREVLDVTELDRYAERPRRDGRCGGGGCEARGDTPRFESCDVKRRLCAWGDC